ncbi:PTB domain-containing adapter protein ced-6 isoform X2 [Lycorma delicatula]|uniref:PTB domain-containing adapter protein ced-6 isoform X2 n=1 Tax=Lycorma delicatula TaxID=130591 RepID=UPI003F50E669
MRNSNLLKWTHNNNKQTDKSGNRSWIHPPDALQKGHIVYLVKFLGNTEVDQPKGIEIVKEGIRKLKFNQQLRKSEGTKTPKVELTISIDGVAIQEPKTKRILHQYPLHRISYCADDKGEKRFFSFIAKDSSESEQHSCFVFVSDKLAEEITLTIGQAFDLAYKRFLETAGKDLEVQRRLILLQHRVKQLETENSVLKQRLSDILSGVDVEEYMKNNSITNLLEVNTSESGSPTASPATEPLYSSPSTNGSSSSGQKKRGATSNNSTTSPVSPPPPVPPRQGNAATIGTGSLQSPNALMGRAFSTEGELISDLTVNRPSVGTKLEGLLMDELEEDFNPRAYESSTQPETSHLTLHSQVQNYNGNPVTTPPLLAPPPPKASRDPNRRAIASNIKNGNSQNEDIFGSAPFNVVPASSSNSNTMSSVASPDPFGMGDFGIDMVAAGSEPSQSDFENAIGLLDKKILEMKDGFSRGLSFGNEDFSLESLDPLRK